MPDWHASGTDHREVEEGSGLAVLEGLHHAEVSNGDQLEGVPVAEPLDVDEVGLEVGVPIEVGGQRGEVGVPYALDGFHEDGRLNHVVFLCFDHIAIIHKPAYLSTPEPCFFGTPAMPLAY